jgi:hypothetical protein
MSQVKRELARFPSGWIVSDREATIFTHIEILDGDRGVGSDRVTIVSSKALRSRSPAYGSFLRRPLGDSVWRPRVGASGIH